MQTTNDQTIAFITAACVPRGQGHTTGTLETAGAILAAHPGVATANIYTAAILGDENKVKEFLSQDKTLATAKGGPHDWDALTYLCFSKYLRMGPEGSNGHLHSAAALLENGADANTGWTEDEYQPQPEWESVLYGAAGIAHHAPLTRLLLQHGADPNDGETTYHTPESYDNEAMKALVESGRLTAESMGTLLLRKADWHDYEGIRYLLQSGADPNIITHWHHSPLQAAILRDNDIRNIAVMMEFGGKPLLTNRRDGRSAVAMAARRGRKDVLLLFAQRGVPISLRGLDALITACAMQDAAGAAALIAENPVLLQELVAAEGTVLAEFSGVGNTEGVALLLKLGVNVKALYIEGDGYYGTARNSTALHVAAWRAQHATLKLLLLHGADVNALDGQGRSALALAVLACVDSYWASRRSPESVEALLKAGAITAGVKYPSGYDEVDELLRQYA